jgi:DNA-binding MarR family transcriptional regulator
MRNLEPRPARAGIISQEQEDAWFALLSTHATATAQIDAMLMERHGLSFSAAEILCRLKDQEPQPVRVLAGQLVSVSPTRASRLVQDFIDEGYLQRGADQADGRISLISFTDEGRRYTAEVYRTVEEAVGKYFTGPLDDEDIAAITRIWGKLQAAGE